MGIRDVMTQINLIQQEISITEPFEMSIKQPYHTYVPDQSDTLADTPCFLNTWTLLPLIRASSFLETQYEIRMQLAVLDAQQDVAADIASAFMDAIIAKFNTKVTLNGSAAHHDLRGGTPTLVGFTWANIPYVGLDLYLHAYLKDIAVFS